MVRRRRSVVPGVAGMVAGVLAVTSALAACGDEAGSGDGRPSVVVTHAVLGAVVADLVGDAADVTVLMPNGTDPHDWEPSAKDLEAVNDAAVVVANGLHLEESLDDALATAAGDGVVVFSAGDHVEVRTIGEGEIPEEHADEHADDTGDEHDDEHADDTGDEHDDEHGVGAEDPHLWMDPLTVRDAVIALAPVLEDAGIDVSARLSTVTGDLESLSAEIDAIVAAVAADDRLLVTGHDSLGYFADRYGFTVVGAVIPSLSSQAEASAGDLAELGEVIDETGVPTIFTELGTPASIVSSIADETGVEVVELATHLLPEDGAYRTFVLDLARAIADGLS